MNWLNKVDHALDWVLGPSSSSNDDGNDDDGRNSSNRQDDEDAIAAAAAASILREVEGIITNNPPPRSQHHVRQSQPQPQPCPATPNTRTKPTASPPPTPLMAMAGEYLVLDESPYASYDNSATTATAATMKNADRMSQMQYSPNTSLETTKVIVKDTDAANLNANTGPFTPSTFVIQTTTSNETTLHHNVPPPPLTNEARSNSSSSTVVHRSAAVVSTATQPQRRTTPGIIRRRLRESSPSPTLSDDNSDIMATANNNNDDEEVAIKVLAAAKAATRTNRPTPGNIRRRLRGEPSPSSRSESPTMSLSDSIGDMAATNDNDVSNNDLDINSGTNEVLAVPSLLSESSTASIAAATDTVARSAATAARSVATAATQPARRPTPGVIRRKLREASPSRSESPTMSLSDSIGDMAAANNDNDVVNNDLDINSGANKVLAVPSLLSESSTAAIVAATDTAARSVATATATQPARRPTPGVIRRRLREASPSRSESPTVSLSDNIDMNMAAPKNNNDEEVATISLAVTVAATTVAAEEKPSITAAATVATAPRNQPQRPTPGIIRRRLREPSSSPPESPTMSLSDSSDIAPDTTGNNISVSRIAIIPPLPSGSSNTDTAAAVQPMTSIVPTMTRVPNRSTPGVIRRRLREPSPPESPTSSMSDNSINSSAKGVISRPMSVGLSTATTAAISARPKGPGIIRRRLREPSPSPPESPTSSMSSSDDAVVPSLLSSTAEHGTVLEEISVGKNMEQVDENNVASNNDDNSMSDDGSFHSESSNDSELTDSNLADDFAVPISSEQDEKVWDPSLNRYGFFHVRLLRAQRLSCSAGSFINATLTLHPWNGRIRIPARTSIVGPEGAGVCLRWDKPVADQKRSPRSKLGSGSKDHGPVDDKEASSHSMVHAYNNPDTPIPAIFLELRSSSLGGLFDRFICSITVPCQEHLRNPRSWQRKWYSAIDIDGSAIDSLVLLEACFEPEATRLTASTITNQIIIEEEANINTSDHLINVSRDSSSVKPGSVPLIIRPTRRGVLDDDSISKSSSTLTPALFNFNRSNTVTKSHLLRVRSFWLPTWCSVCASSIISGWTQGFECEACHIFCCRDCQLQVDVRIPCGSELSMIAVKKAQQYQVPSFGQIMTTLAPQLDVHHTANLFGSNANPNQQSGQPTFNLLHEGRSMDGIGIMNVRILRACLFDKTFPPETEPNKVFDSDFNLRNGDHYVRISWLGSKESKRTKTVLQTSKPFFDSEEMIFDVPHYGMEYKLEVIDSNTDKPIGSYLLSAQSLLQWQRDDMFSSMDKILLSFFHLRKFSEPRRVKLELRTGVKDGYGLNYYNSSTSTGDSTRKDKESTQRPGEISGWLEIDVHLEEDRRLFYSSNPRRISRPIEEFDTNMIQLHIARISAIVESIQQILSSYFYVVSWENQELTGASMILFVILTLRFNVEYLGALPVGCLALYMIYLGYLRVDGHFKDRWCCQEKEALIKSESKIETNKSIFRPLGILQIGQLRGKHLRSNDLGLPGSFYATIMYDPLRYADEKMKASIIKLDSSSGCIHQVGATISPGITSSPVWSQLHESPELMRLKYLLPNDRLFACETDASLAYPILQPITDGRSIDEMIDGDRNTGISLMPWEQSYGAIVIQVRFSDVLGSFHMFDNNLGEVVIPLAKLAGSGRPVEGWFRLLDVGTTDTLPGESSYNIPGNSQTANESFLDDIYEDGLRPAAAIEYPELYLNAKFTSKLFPTLDKYGDKESFKVVCEEMSRTASMAQENRIGVIGSSLSTINTIRTLGGTLQNQLSYLVDMLERARNAFNFSNPRISCFILLCLSILWVVLARIPTRFVVLIGGMAQFGATFYAKYLSPPSSNTPRQGRSDEVADSANVGNPFENLFLSIPTDEDLRRTYFWEARRVGEKERNKFANAKRESRLEKLWKAKWYGTLALKVNKAEQTTTTATNTISSSRSWNWESAFGLIEGHRFIWWASERHFDTGESSLGQIYFAGHSGLAGLSPLDLRELSKEEVPLVVSIFGRGPHGQQKLTILTLDLDAKEWLENSVLDASMDAKAD